MKNLLIGSWKKLKPKQRHFMWVFMDNGGHLTKTCNQMKMHTDTFYRWMQNPEFKSYHDFVIQLHTQAFDAVINKALIDKCIAGDVRAIRTYYELKGKLKTHETKIDAKNVQYTVRFGKGEGADNRLHPASEPGDDT